MTSASLVRFALVGTAALVTAGVVWTWRERDACSTVAPRLIDVPAEARPIGVSREDDFPRELALSAPAQYEQPQASGGASHITEVSSALPSAGGWPIHEPAVKTVQGPIAQPAMPPRRSEFVPIAMPAPNAPPIGTAAPELPAAGDFSRRASQPASGPAVELQLTRPDGAGWAGPSVPSPENAGREWNVVAQPATTTVANGPAVEAGMPGRRERGRESIAAAPVSNSRSVGAIDSRPQAVLPLPLGEGTARPPSAAMQVVSQRALQMADQATAMANRGMLYSAHSELLQALALIAQALDVQTATDRHAAALNSGITALAEAREFAATNIRGGEAVNVGSIAAGHRTPILNGNAGAGLSAVVAQQQYFGYAQMQLALAAGNVPAGSQILYRLGRLQTAMAGHDADPLALHGPAAIVYHQAALAIDRANWLAANELGVLYARYGQLAEARDLLIHSVAVHSNLEGWHNLSIVHRRLGEADLAQKANTEWQLLAKQTGQTRTDANEMVRWIDPQTFAAGNSADARWQATTAAKPVTAQNAVRR